MHKKIPFLCLVALSLEAADYTVITNSDDPTVSGSLPNVINQINTDSYGSPNTNQNFTISFDPSVTSITLTAPLPPIVASPSATITGTINGGGVTIDGSGTNSAFIFIGNGPQGSGQFAVSNMTIQNAVANGGPGGEGLYGGGGGAGLGGAVLLLNGASATVQSIAFNNNGAQGGPGGNAILNYQSTGSAGAAGGGGIHGAGGSAGNFSEAGGGGLMGNAGNVINGGGSAGGGLTGNAGDSTQGSGSGGGGFYCAAATTCSVDGQPDQSGIGGNGGGTNGGAGGNNAPGTDGGLGGGGGGGGGGSSTAIGGNGGYGGGGGSGSGGANGGNGGFGGGGGSSGTDIIAIGGNAGFGGGGGTGYGGNSSIDPPSTGGNGGFGGGGASASISTGGVVGGSGGFGGGSGAVVITSNPGAGNVLTPGTPGFGAGSGAAFVSNTVPTAGGGGGASLGGAIFIPNDGSLSIVDCTFSGSSVTPSSGGTAEGGGVAGTGGQALGADIFLMSGGTLNFNLTSNLTLENPIEGDQGAGGGSTTAGGLIKSGPALLNLPGANTYTGLTNVEAGELHIDGSVISNVQVQPGATLSGECSILQNLINGGRVSPGDDELGAISVAGNFTNQASGTFAIGITPTASGLLTVAGTGSLDGTIEVLVNNGTYLNGTQYTVIQGPTTGAFSHLTKVGPFADYVILDVSYGSAILTIRNNPIFDPIFSSPVARAVANCIVSAAPFADPDFAFVVDTIGRFSNHELTEALISLSPVNYGALDWINERNNSLVQDIIADHLYELCCSPRDCSDCACNMAVWIDVFGNLMDNRKHFNYLSPYNANAVGVVTGLDYCFCDNFTVGAAFAYDHTWLDWKHHHGNGHINSYSGALYGSYESCCLTLDVAALGGASDHDLKRKIHIVGTDTLTGAPISLNRTAKSDPWGYFFNGHLGIRTDWEWCFTTFEPFGLIDYNYFQLKHFNEHGAGSLDLRVREHHQNMLRGEVGLRVSRAWLLECSCFGSYLGLSWVGEFPLGHSKEKASFINQSCVIDVTSYHSSAQLASPEAGIKWTSLRGLSWSIGYKGLYNSEISIDQIETRFEWIF